MFEAIQKETFLSQATKTKLVAKVPSRRVPHYPLAKQILLTDETQAWLVDYLERSAFNDNCRPGA